MKILEKLLSDPYDFIENAKLSDITKLIKYANDAYFNTSSPIMSDEEYDLLKDELYKRKPDHSLLSHIGSQVHSKKKVVLPYHMGSMDKIKPNTGVITKWITKYKGPYVYSDKLDGTSALLVLPDKKLYTRGNGSQGTYIASILPYINGIPKYTNKTKIVVRGELMISKANFKKFENKFANSRAMVNGLVNKKSAEKEDLQNIDFVAYEIVDPPYKISKQYSELKKYKFNVVNNGSFRSINDESLCEHLKTRKKNSRYDIDGIIIVDDNQHSRNTRGNPKYAFAFKDILEEQMAVANIDKVEWNISKNGLLIPRIFIKPPVKIGGIKIQHVTGHNAKFIKDNGIGKGSKIKLIRSGDVIPHILEVIKKVTPSFPNTEYKWNSTNVNIMIDKSKINDTQKNKLLIKNITYFLKKSGIKNADESIVKKFINAGLDSIPKILKASNDDFLKVDGFKDRMAHKIYTNIRGALKNIKLNVLMAASNLFGASLGARKMLLIVDEYPNILKMKLTKSQLIEKLNNIDGFNTITSTSFAEGLPKFKQFMKKLPSYVSTTVKKDSVSKNTKVKKLKVVFSGFRNADWVKIIEGNGGKVSNTVGKSIDVLVV